MEESAGSGFFQQELGKDAITRRTFVLPQYVPYVFTYPYIHDIPVNTPIYPGMFLLYASVP